jgi:hypothetical protein
MDGRFKSIGRSGVGYEILSYKDKFDGSRAHRFISEQIGEYETYGDGITKHSGSWMAHTDNILDCIASLAIFAMDHKDDEEFKSWLTSFWPRPVDEKSIDFALTVKFDEKKTKYYNLQERKISSSEKLQYDKRWSEIPQWCVGNLESVLRLIVPDYYHDALTLFYYYTEVRSYLAQKLDWYDSVDGYFIGWQPTDNYQSMQLQSAFYVINSIVKSWQYADNAQRSLDCLKHNLRIDEESAA